MQFLANQTLAMTLMAAALAPVDVNAQIGQANSDQAVGTITPSNGAAGLTLSLSLVAVLLLLFSGWKGGDLVFRGHIGVAD